MFGYVEMCFVVACVMSWWLGEVAVSLFVIS